MLIDSQTPGKSAAAFPFTLITAGWGIPDARNALFERTDYEVCTVEYVVRGRGFLESDGRRAECRAGGVYFLHRHSNHRFWPERSDPWQKQFFIINGALADHLITAYRLNELLYLPGVPELQRYFESMLQLGYGDDDKNRRAAVIFHQFAEACFKAAHVHDDGIRPEIAALKKALEAGIDGKFRLAEFGRQAGFTPAHLIRHFRAAFGCSPYEYLMRQRIESARRMLVYSGMSVKEIAAALGFSDQYYFSGCFRRRIGVSPSRYRSGRR